MHWAPLARLGLRMTICLCSFRVNPEEVKRWAESLENLISHECELAPSTPQSALSLHCLYHSLCFSCLSTVYISLALPALTHMSSSGTYTGF